MWTIDYRKVEEKAMCTFIGVECLAVNALIELYKQGISEISFKKLAEYGLAVIEHYKIESEENAVLIFEANDLQGLVMNYSAFFTIKENDNQKYLCLKPQVAIVELKEQFVWTLSYAMLKAISYVDIMDIMTN